MSDDEVTGTASTASNTNAAPPSHDDRVRAARFERLMSRYADILYVELKKKSDLGNVLICSFSEAPVGDRRMLLDVMAGDAASYERVHGDPTRDGTELSPEPPAPPPLGTRVPARIAAMAGERDIDRPTSGPKLLSVTFEAIDEQGLYDQAIGFLTTHPSVAGRETPRVAEDIRDAIAQRSFSAEVVLSGLRRDYQKVVVSSNPGDQNDASARLWHSGAGMLPQNVEVARCGNREDAIRALDAAARIAFPVTQQVTQVPQDARS